MGHSILIDNQKNRKEIPFWQLVCFVMFVIWQMGVVYYIGPALNIDGRTPLPVPADNMTLLIVIAYGCSIFVMCMFPSWVIRLSRMSTIIALLAALGLFLPLDTSILLMLVYIQSFCCCFMIGFETATIVYFFSEGSVMRHLLLAYPVAYIMIGILQNDFVKLDFAVFRFFIVIMLVFLFIFYMGMPGKKIPRFVKKEDHLVMPKAYFAGVCLLVFLTSFLGVIGPAVTAQFTHGVCLCYVGGAGFSLIVYGIYKKSGQHPLQLMSVVVGITLVGYLFLLLAEHVPGISLTACVLIGAGVTACSLIPSFGIALSKQYPSKFIAPGFIVLALLAVIIQSTIVEIFRSSMVLLNLTYFVIVVFFAFVFVILEPYLIYSMRRKWVEPEVQEVKSPFMVLTKRELEIVDLIGAGYSNKDVAKMLFISEYTVKDHTKNIYRKLEVHSRYELMALLNQWKWK